MKVDTPPLALRPLSVTKVFDDGDHAAVTSLARFRGRWYLAFRHAHRHQPWPPGDVVVLASRDLARWEPCARVSTGLDDRDPKLVPDGERLWLFFGAHREERDAEDRRVPGVPRLTWSFASWTEDGRAFAPPVRISEASWWLWSPARFDDGFWCAAYGRDEATAGPGHELVLFRSADGLAWERGDALLPAGAANEACLLRRPDGSTWCIARGAGDETHVLAAHAPGGPWARRTLPHWAHAPAALDVDGRVLLAGRDRVDGGYVTRLWELGPEGSRHLLDLESGGDTSYCGLARDDDGSVLVSYYSQHEFLHRPGFRVGERPAAVYLARLSVLASDGRAGSAGGGSVR